MVLRSYEWFEFNTHTFFSVCSQTYLHKIEIIWIKWALGLNILMATADSMCTIFWVTGNLCIFCVQG